MLYELNRYEVMTLQDACVAADKKPKAAPTAALMLATCLLAMWAE